MGPTPPLQYMTRSDDHHIAYLLATILAGMQLRDFQSVAGHGFQFKFIIIAEFEPPIR